MLIDARELPDKAEISGQFCIVGGGVTGLLIALELGGLGYDVVVVEAGGARVESRARLAARGNVGESEHEPLEDVSARRLGGALSLWGGRLLPLDSADFEAQSAGGGWPISFEDLLPFYHRANQELGGGRFQYTSSLALRDSPALLIDRPFAMFEERKLWRWGPPVRYKHFRKRIAQAHNIRLYHHCVAQELESDSSASTVARFRATSFAHQRLTFSAEQFVLSAGGLEVARLLLNSRSKLSSPMGAGFDQVGRNYVTHPVAEVGLLSVTPSVALRLCTFEKSHDGVYCRRLLCLREELRKKNELPNLNLTFWSPDPHDPSHGDGVLSAYAMTKRFLIQRRLTDKVAGAHRSNLRREARTKEHLRNMVLSAPRTIWDIAGFGMRRWGQKRQIPALLRAGSQGVIRLRLDAEQRPDDANFVCLDGDRDEFGMRRLKVSYRVSTRDREAYYRTLMLLQREVAFAKAGVLWLPDKDEFRSLRMGDGTHQMGLTRMSPTPSSGVVDQDCRVHGLNNLFVASCSVFPTAGAAPPTLTLVALAFRLVDHLVRRASQSSSIPANLRSVA